MDDTNNMTTAIHGNPAQLGEFFAALSKAQQQIDPAKKRSTNPHFKSKYADLNTVLDAILPGLNENNLSLMQLVGETQDGCVSLTTILGHKSGAYVLALASCPLGRGGGPQGAGSGLTYLRRYAAQAIVGLGAEDDDGNDAQGKARAKAEKEATAELRRLQHLADIAESKAIEAEERAEQLNAPHDPSWEASRKGFMAAISEMGLSYAEVKFICASQKPARCKPSQMKKDQLKSLQAWLGRLSTEKKDKWIGQHGDALEEKKHSNV